LIIIFNEKDGLMMEQKLAQLQAKFEADASLGEKLFSLETPAEVQSLLKEQGLDFTLDEIAALREAIVKAVEESENGELSDKAMEVVVGGVLGSAPPFLYQTGRKQGDGKTGKCNGNRVNGII
jgi:hypothetical protein